MTTIDYSALDAAVLAVLASGPMCLADVYVDAGVRPAADAVAQAVGDDGRRVLDRRLTQLRTAGTVQRTPAGWSLP